MEPSNRLPYYEDFYGEQNEDEAFDRFPDECEEETDSDNDMVDDQNQAPASGAYVGFFRPYATPKSGRKPELPRFGEIRWSPGRFSNSLPFR